MYSKTPVGHNQLPPQSVFVALPKRIKLPDNEANNSAVYSAEHKNAWS